METGSIAKNVGPIVKTGTADVKKCGTVTTSTQAWAVLISIDHLPLDPEQEIM